MMVNLTESAPLCLPDQTMCQSEIAAACLTVLNIICVIVNLIHIIVLAGISSLKGKSYLSLLLDISCSDIIYTSLAILYVDCNIREVLSASRLPGLWNMLFGSFGTAAVLFQYVPVCLSSIVRYISVCRPYSTNHVAEHVGKLAALNGLIFFLVSFLTFWTGFEDICVDSVIGPTLKVSTLATVISTVTLWAPMIVTIVLSTLVLVELRRMNRRAPANQDTDELKRASHYIIVVNTIFYTLMCPQAIIVPILLAVGGGIAPQSFDLFKWVAMYMNGFYSFANTLVFGFMFKSYQERTRQILGSLSLRKPTTVHPV